MAISSRTTRIGIALLISVCFMAFGYFAASPLHTDIAKAGSIDAALKAYATKDTDGDGLPDWKESLYGTDTENAHSVDKTMTDGEAVAAGKVKPKFSSAAPAATTPTTAPKDEFEVGAAAAGSLTDEFAKAFFESYTETDGTSADQAALVESLMVEYRARVAEKLASSYTVASVHVSSATDVDTYAAGVQQAYLKNAIIGGAPDAPDAIDSYITNSDVKSLADLRALEKSYRGTADALAALSVPATLKDSHLALMRSYDSLAKSMRAIADFKTDPLATLGAIGVYQTSATDIRAAFATMSAAILLKGEPAEGTPGAYIVNTSRAQPAS